MLASPTELLDKIHRRIHSGRCYNENRRDTFRVSPIDFIRTLGPGESGRGHGIRAF